MQWDFFPNISVELKVGRMYKLVSRFKSPVPQGSYIKLKDGKMAGEPVQWENSCLESPSEGLEVWLHGRAPA